MQPSCSTWRGRASGIAGQEVMVEQEKEFMHEE